MSKQLQILYISHYYPPEVNAPAVRVSGLAHAWSQRGHKVSVLTGFPNHPGGIIPPVYRGKLGTNEMDGPVRVLRTWLYAAPNKGFAKRILNYLTFMFSAILSGLIRSGKQDIIIATSPQFFVAVAGYILSRLKRVPFVFEVRDVWPEEIVAVGAMKRGVIIRALERVEMFLYRKAVLIVAVAQGTIDILTARGVPAEKIVLLPNGVDLEEFEGLADNHEIRDQLNLNGHFLVSYIGTHGMAHNLKTIVKAAHRLRNQEDIRFMFVGDGADKGNLLKLKEQLGLENITFVPQQPREAVPRYYATSDLCLVPLRTAGLFTKNIPSKIYEVMACGKPIVIGTHGESRRLVEEAGAGIGVEPDDDAALARAILDLSQDHERIEQMGVRGRVYAEKHCRRSDIADRYITRINQLVSPS